ncbi:MAG: FtsX-like permease family protein [Candidatus Thermoplasmatota archaeon]|nr:FtsX-like permease family protein [Candidatus Thermoplasmatota archaeon]
MMRTTFLKKGVREIWAHKVQYFFLVLVLGLGIASYGSLYDMAESREASLDAIYEASLFMDVQVMIEYGQALNATTLDAIFDSDNLSGMISVKEYRLTFDVFINHTSVNEPKVTRGLMMGYDLFDEDGSRRELSVNRPLYYVDDPPNFAGPFSEECFIEHNFAKAYDIDSGDSIGIIRGSGEISLDVLEHANIPEYFWVVTEGNMMPSERSLGVVMVPIDTAMKVHSGMDEPMYNDIAILLKDPSQVEEFKELARSEFAKAGVIVKPIGKEENPARRFHYDDLENDKQNTATFPLIIFTISGFGLVMTLRRMIRTHRTQIGIFKSLGVPNRVILTYFLIIGLLIAILGVIAGLLLSIPLRMAFVSMITSLLGFAIVETSLAYHQYLIASAIGIVICLSSTIVPAWFALRIKPVDAIQSREGISRRSAGRIATRIGKRSKLPVPVKLTVRNFLRKPARTATTVIGVALSLALFLGFMIAMNSIVVMLDNETAHTRWDYEIALEGFVFANVTSKWELDHPEIESVNPGIMLPTRVLKADEELFCMVYALSDVEAAFDLEYNSGGLRPGEIVISRYMAEKFGWHTGGEAEIELPFLDPASGFSMRRMVMNVSGIHSNMIGFYIFTDITAVQDISNLHGLANIVYLKVDGGRPVPRLQNAMVTTPGVTSVLHVEDRDNILEQYFEIFVVTVYIMGLVSTILSMAIVYNLFMIDAHEKRREYATMKTLGTSLKRIGYLIFIESGLVLAIGIPLGALGGMGLAYYMFSVADEWEAMNMEVAFTWIGFLVGSLMMIGVTVLVSFLTIRYISKINIANVIRERSSG